MSDESVPSLRPATAKFDRYAHVRSLKGNLASTNLVAAHQSLLADEPFRGFAPELPAGSDRLAHILGARSQRTQFGEHLNLQRWFSESIGEEPSDAPFNLDCLRLLVPDAPAEAANPANWLFLDTETTGLAGGTGTYPFLVGIAWWDAGGLQVEQFFMREHSEEHSVLTALAERLVERPVLVTFNGKTFDWPLLETRYRMTRTITIPRLLAHFDFLHPARNFWRLRLGSARLPDLERHVLGWERVDFLASELIPQIYFDFVRGGPPEPLIPIFHHNQMDLRGLAGLACRVLSLLNAPETHGRDSVELFGLSRILERRGKPERARFFYQQSIAGELPDEALAPAQQSLARLAKREGDFGAACEIWQKMLGNTRHGLEAYEQLAIHYERRARDPQRAISLVRDALKELRKAKRLGLTAPSAHQKHVLRFEKRLARLTRRMKRIPASQSDKIMRSFSPSTE